MAFEVNSGAPLEFVFESEDRFVHKSSGTRIDFVRDDQGSVTELVMHRGGEQRAKKITGLLSPIQARSVTVDGKAFRTVISGAGSETVVLVKGLDSWSKVAGGIEKVARVVRYQRASHFSASSTPKDIRTQAQELHRLLQDLEIAHPCTFVGHSFDGGLIRVYADLYPEQVGALVLVDPIHESFLSWLQTHQPANYELLRKQAVPQYVSDWDDFLERLSKARLPSGVPVVLLTAGQREIRENDTLEKQLDSGDLRVGAEAVLAAHRDWIETVDNGSHVIVPSSGHGIPVEQPAAVVEAIRGILDALEGG